jgi:hypothetical protein
MQKYKLDNRQKPSLNPAIVSAQKKGFHKKKTHNTETQALGKPSMKKVSNTNTK